MTEQELIDLSMTMAMLKGVEPTNANLFDLYYQLRDEHRTWMARVEKQHPTSSTTTISPAREATTAASRSNPGGRSPYGTRREDPHASVWPRARHELFSRRAEV